MIPDPTGLNNSSLLLIRVSWGGWAVPLLVFSGTFMWLRPAGGSAGLNSARWSSSMPGSASDPCLWPLIQLPSQSQGHATEGRGLPNPHSMFLPHSTSHTASDQSELEASPDSRPQCKGACILYGRMWSLIYTLRPFNGWGWELSIESKF